MPRMARVVISGCPHHVTQRGNSREDVFFSDADRAAYLGLLSKYASKHGLAVQAYCLMTNHVHLVVVPRSEASLADTLKPLHMRYAQHVNWTQRIGGRLWQGRFFSCPMDDEHLWSAVRYVERNPVRAGMIERAEDYRWSSAAGHCGLRGDPLLSDPCEMTERLSPERWRRWLGGPWEAEDEVAAQLRQCTQTGRPAGGSNFIKRLETIVGRVLRAKKVGRPRKQEDPTPGSRKSKKKTGSKERKQRQNDKQ